MNRRTLSRVIALILLVAIAVTGIRLMLKDREEDTPSDPKVFENTVTVVNVGQGSCTVIQSDGQFALIDVGTGEDSKTDIPALLERRGADRIKTVVLTHFHYDHTSQMLDVMSRFKVDTVIIPDLSEENAPDTAFYRLLLENAGRDGYTVLRAKKDLTVDVGNGQLRVLADTNNSGDTNDTSVILTFTHGDFIYLDTGDAGIDTVNAVMDWIPSNVSLYDGGHHGSSDAISYDLMRKIRPKLTVFSCGQFNDFRHPHKKVTDSLKKLDLDYLTTREYGNVVYSITEDRLVKGVH